MDGPMRKAPVKERSDPADLLGQIHVELDHLINVANKEKVRRIVCPGAAASRQARTCAIVIG